MHTRRRVSVGCQGLPRGRGRPYGGPSTLDGAQKLHQLPVRWTTSRPGCWMPVRILRGGRRSAASGGIPTGLFHRLAHEHSSRPQSATRRLRRCPYPPQAPPGIDHDAVQSAGQRRAPEHRVGERLSSHHGGPGAHFTAPPDAPGRPSARHRRRALAHLRGAAGPSVTRMCDRLEALGFIRRPCPESGREFALRLTPAARPTSLRCADLVNATSRTPSAP